MTSSKLLKIQEALRMFPEGSVHEALLKEKAEIEAEIKKQAIEDGEVDVKAFAQMVINQEHDHKVSYKKFINSVSNNCLIYAPTQVGKTEATKELIEVCCKENIPVVVSCDNKSDQLSQLYTRMANDLEANENIVLVKATESKFGSILKTAFKEKKNVIVFCLDNPSQLKKVKEQFVLQMTLEKTTLGKVALISDEGDVITKDCNVEEIEEEQCESHKEWIRMTTYFGEMGVDVKRVFVTATPENVLFKYKVEHVLRLNIPKDYVGCNQIQYIEMKPEDIKDILTQEQNRRLAEGENGVILYCVDKKIHEGQDPTFVSVCSYLKKCIVNTYNGNGIMARVLNNSRFEARLKKFVTLNNKNKNNKKITYYEASTNETKNVWQIKNMAIKDFYQICKDVGCGVVVTIGMDLIARGISFVSSDVTPDAMAATTMIYRPGTTLHAVGLCQAIGRITGMARPDLERRLYAPADVIDTYKKYIDNQQQYLDEITEANGVVTSKIMEQIELNHKLSRPLDRVKLKLKPLYKEHRDPVEDDTNRMQQLVDMWWNAESVIGKILRFVYDSQIGVSELELKEFISNTQTTNIKAQYDEPVKRDRGHCNVFHRTSNQITKLVPEARKYISQKYFK